MSFKKHLKKFSAVICAVAVCIAFTACGSKGSGDKVYKVGMEPTFPPFDTTNEKGDLDGFDVDLMKAIAKDQGFKVEFKSLEFDGLITGLKSGNIDIVASGMWASDDRKKEVDFSDTYYESGLVVAVNANDNKIKSIDDLDKNSKVAAQIGTSSAELIQKMQKEGKIKEAKIYNKVNDAVQDLQNGSVSALINDKPVTKEYMNKQKGKIKIVGDPLNKENLGIGVQKGNKELLDKINKGLANLKKSGEFDKLLKKWNLN